MNGSSAAADSAPVIRNDEDSDVEMDTSEEVQNGHNAASNGKVSPTTNGYQNGSSHNKSFPENLQKEDDNMGMFPTPPQQPK